MPVPFFPARGKTFTCYTFLYFGGLPANSPAATIHFMKKNSREDESTHFTGLNQNPHDTLDEGKSRDLEKSIGREVKRFREKLHLTITELAKAAGMSAGMLSKIENGATSPSLSSLQALSVALHVPVTSLFRSFEEIRDATFVPAGAGLTIERRGTRAGHQYELLGHSPHGAVMVEPYIVSLTEQSDVFPIFQHSGLEFLHMLEGEVVYRHGNRTYHMRPGDSLFFDAEAPHGPEELVRLPIRFLCVISYKREG